ncbi:MAG: Wzz/FepE/Etk N-terminal domain-containing protein [Pseudomonadota bacterium]
MFTIATESLFEYEWERRVMTSSATVSNDADIDIGKLFSAIWRDKVKIAAIATVLTALMYAFLSMAAPTFTADTRILIEANDPVFTRPVNETQTEREPILDEEGVTSQVDILTSSELLVRVANDLGLGNREEFDDALSIGAVKMVLITFGLVADPRELTKDERVLKNVRERLSVFAREASRVIVVEFTSEDKALSWKFPNALARAYVELEGRASLDTTESAAQFLASEVDQLQREVREAERRVADFRSSSGLLEGENNEILATQQLAELTTELSRVRSDRTTARARANAVQATLNSGASIDALPDVIGSPIIARLREREISLRGELAELSVTLLDNHPEVRALRSQLDGLSQQIRVEAGKVLEALRSEASIAVSRENELERELNQLKAAAATANEREVELNALQREANSQRALLESYLIRFREAQARQETDYAPAKARVISSATAPLEPSFPKMIPMLAVTFIGTILLGCLVTVMRELFSGRALTPVAQPPQKSAAEETSPVTLKAEDPDQTLAQRAAMAAAASAQSDPPPLAAEVEQERPSVLARKDIDPDEADRAKLKETVSSIIKSGASRILVATPEGSTAASGSVALARACASQNLSSVLVDLGASGASSRQMVGNARPGITELLVGKASFQRIIHADRKSAAHCVPLGAIDLDEAASSLSRLPIVFDGLRSAYDLVIIECGATDVEALSEFADADTEIVLATTDDQLPVMMKTKEAFERNGLSILAVLTTDKMETQRGNTHRVAS